jgi:hypothetical protein
MSKPYAAIHELVERLRSISRLPLDAYEASSDAEAIALQTLKENGLIRSGACYNKSFNNLQITPSGISRLVDWEAFLYNNSPRGKFSNWAYQFSWVLVGALLSSGDRVLSCFVQTWGN